MNKPRKNRNRIHPLVRHLILAVSLVIIFLIAVNLSLNLFTRHGQSKTVPDFAGMSFDEALAAADRDDLRLEITDSLYVPIYAGGTVLEQHPAPGSRVKSGRRIFLTVNSYAQKRVEVPYVTGLSLRQARSRLETAGLTIDRLVYAPDIAADYVLEERAGGRVVTPDRPATLEMGSGVVLVVGTGTEPRTATVPRVTELPLNKARSRLWESGLNIGTVVYDNDVNLLNRKDARIWRQEPGQSREVDLGTPVKLYLSIDTAKVARKSAEADREAERWLSERRAQADSLAALKSTPDPDLLRSVPSARHES